MVPIGVRRCGQCEPANQRPFDNRDSASIRGYGRSWQKIRAAYARKHPLCEDCLEENRVRPLEDVHHIVPLTQGGKSVSSNLRSLCHQHHMKREAEARRVINPEA
jgi:5-methylcytosine-specific restriction protein A